MQLVFIAVAACLCLSGVLSLFGSKCPVGKRFLLGLTLLAIACAALYGPSRALGAWRFALWGPIWAGAGFTLVMAVLFFISSLTNRADGTERAILVLGVELEDGRNIGPLLEKRLITALNALGRNPALIAVLCGGRVEGETLAEARVMEAWLLNHGVAPERLIVEDGSLTTKENFINARALLEARGFTANEPYAVVTNRFHCFRVKNYAAGAGFDRIRLLPAPTGCTDAPAWYLREVLVTIKYWITGA